MAEGTAPASPDAATGTLAGDAPATAVPGAGALPGAGGSSRTRPSSPDAAAHKAAMSKAAVTKAAVSKAAVSKAAVSKAAPGVLATLVYAAGAIYAYQRVLFAPTLTMPGCNCGDQAQEVWFLRWPLYAVAHGLNPFFSTWMNYPKGFNIATNTASLLLAFLSAPLQLTIGTVTTYDVLLVVAFVASALAMCLALRRFVRSWFAAFAGGLLYGFSPYMIGEGHAHLFLVAAFIPPIVLVLLEETVVRQRHGPVRDGLVLGVLLVLQYFISPEVLAMTAIVGVCGVALLAVARPSTARSRAPHVLLTAAISAVVCAAALAYPVWFELHGRQHVVGPPHPLSFFAAFPGDLLGPLVPTSNQLLATAALQLHGDALVGHNPDENGLYLGIPLLVVLLVLAWAFRRRRTIPFFVAMAMIAGILALGPQLVVDGHHTGVPLPAWVLEHLPLLKGILDVRFSLFLQMAVAAALAVGLDELGARAAGRVRRLRGSHTSGTAWWAAWRRRLWSLGAPALVAVVALLPLLPAEAYPPGPTSTPAFFTSPALDRIPNGAAVLTYPYVLVPVSEWNLTFQVEAGLRYKVFGADALVPDGPGRSGVSTPTPPTPGVVEHLLADAYTPALARARLGTPPGTPTPPVDAKTVAALRTFLARYRVDAVLVEDLGLHPQTVVGYVTDALGRPVETGGIWAWFDVPRLLTQIPH
jgi:hypothetical protein